MSKLKKSGFLEGAFIATLCIIITKLLGILYVIPFYKIIGEQGGTLYGYAYNIYNIFLIISSAGIPLAISKLTSEYHTLKQDDKKVRMYEIATKIISIFSISSFLICFIFAPQLSNLIIGKLEGGNTIEDVTFVIRLISFALLIIPMLSIKRGYLQGHTYIKEPSISQIIEQVVRIAVIIIGSYLCVRIFKLPIKFAVGISVLTKKNKKQIGLTEKIAKNKEIDHEIIKKIITYSIPFIVINLANTIYTFTDMVLVIRTLPKLGFAATDTEFISSVFTTWGVKFNTIITSISTGLIISLIPNIVKHYTMKNTKGVKETFNKALEIVIFLALPLTILISIYAKDVWYVFYGNNTIGPIILTLNIYVAFISAISTTLTSALQGLSKYKIVYISILAGIVCNALLDVPLILLMNKLNIYPYYGAVIASIIGFSVSNIIALRMAKKACKIDYKPTYQMLLKIALSVVLLLGSALLLKNFVTYSYNSRYKGLFMTALYFIVPLGIYIFLNYKNGIISDLLKSRKID